MKLMDMFKRWWQEAAPVARAALVVGAVAIFGSIAYFLTTNSVERPVPLFVGMSAADASSLASELDGRNIPYELQDNGTTVAVRLPPDEMRKLRLELSADGLPGGRVTGWDIFDETSVTLTEFERKVMYQRALQGELARTVTELPQVRSARVHLALPTKSLLERDHGEPSASVYVSLERGRSLGEKVADGIANLVASSVPDLAYDHIAIMDGDGTMIREPDDGTGGGGKILEVKEERERTLEKDIVDLLEKTVGPGHVMAKVEVDMDLTQVQETLEQYDPDNTALRTERKTTEETSSERSQPSAVSGTQANLPQVPAGEDSNFKGSKSKSNREVDTREFAVPRTVRQVKKPLGEVRKLSIAVVVDTNPFQSSGGGSGEEGSDSEASVEVPDGVESPGAEVAAPPPPPQPSPELLASLVKSAVGFDDSRGDQIEISFVPFVRPDTVGGDEIQYVESPIAPWMWVLITFLAGIGLVAGALWMTEKRRRETAIADYARQLREKEDLLKKQKEEEEEGAVPNSARLRAEVRDLTNKNVGATVEVMKTWLRPTLGRN